MILGTHNSMTYLKPRKWWMRLINFTAKCQSVDLETQVAKYGVHYIDIRVKLNKGKLVLAHGLVEYDLTPYQACGKIAAYASTHKDEQFYLRVMLENDFNDTEEQRNAFRIFCSIINGSNVCKNLHIVGGYEKKNGTKIYEFNDCDLDICGAFSSMSSNKLIHLWPWLYAKKHNKESYENGTDKDVLMLDFIEIGHEQNK